MVDVPTTRKKDWALTPEAFERLLERFDPDRDRAGAKYEELRRKLLKFFSWWGSEHPEENADQTLDRVGRKLCEGEQIENLNHYTSGVARFVFKEYQKGQIKERETFEQLPRDTDSQEHHIAREARLDCYEQCLGALPAESRDLLLSYYREEQRKKARQREDLSKRLGIPLNLLRIRAFRLRNSLAECVQRCIERQ